MDVIGHDYERIQLNVWKMHRNVAPTLFGDAPGVVQLHLSLHYGAK